jgi:hypothetical protein
MVLPMLLALACASDQRLVQDAAAAQIYFAHDYMRQCVKVKGPEDCKQWQVEINELKDEVQICNETQKIGKLPKRARGRLRELMKRLEE